MPCTLFHGDDTLSSRARYLEQLTSISTNHTVHKLAGSNCSLELIQSLTSSNDLFGNSTALALEKLLSLPQSKERTKLFEFLNDASFDVLIWEPKKLTALQLKKIPSAKKELFSISPKVFEWLDMLGGTQPMQQQLKTLQQALKESGEQQLLYLLTRHLRNLLLAGTGEIVGPPFVQTKLKKQLSNCTAQRVVQWITQLAEFDRMKLALPLSTTQWLEHWLVTQTSKKS